MRDHKDMERLLFPEIFNGKTIAFFTGKRPGAEIERIAEIASVEKQNIYMPVQRHTDKVLILDSFEPKVADAVITNKKGTLIGVQVADCVPILLHDKKTTVIGAVHAGWRGTAAGILKKAVMTMVNRFDSSPADILIALGPSIRWCCYIVGYDVVAAAKSATGNGNYVVERGERYCLDLSTANKYQALSVGVLPEHIWMSDECTYCYPDRYYSYRYARGTTGRQGGFIGIV